MSAEPAAAAHPSPLAQPGIIGLLGPQLRAARRRAAESGGLARGLVLGALAVVFWLLLFAILYRMLLYFRGAEDIGELLAAKVLGLVFLAFLSLLVLSNIITALSSFFLARDLELLMASPVEGIRIYLARLVDTLAHSSWMVVLVMVPILGAYGLVYRGGPLFVLVAAATLFCFLVLPSVLGSAVTLVLVNVFPARRARDLLALVALFGVAAFILFIRVVRPEQLAKPEGFRDLVDFVATLDTPRSVWLPSDWAADAIMAPLRDGRLDLFPLLLLASTAAAFVVGGAWLHGRLYPEGFSRAQEGAELQEELTEGGRRRRLESVLQPVPTTVRALVAKDIRTFFRDTTQWSQLILLGVLVVVYVYNIRALPLHTGERVSFFLINIVSFLNLALAGFVLSAIAARFLFPAVSLEGRSLWLLRSSPLDLRVLVWTKYWVGLLPLLILALALTLGTNLILRVEGFMMVLSLATITLITFAIASLALGFGALFPRFETENAAQISTGFGGLLFMMVATGYLAGVIVLEAWPVYAVLRARLRGYELGSEEIARLVAGLGLVALLSLLAIILPLKAAIRRIGVLEG